MSDLEPYENIPSTELARSRLPDRDGIKDDTAVVADAAAVVGRRVLDKFGLGAALDFRDRRAQRHAELYIEAAIGNLDDRVAGIEDRLHADPELNALFFGGMDEARKASTAKKVRLLAAVVRGALCGEPTDVSEGAIVLRVVASLEAEHMDALVFISNEKQKPPKPYNNTPGFSGALPHELQNELPYRSELLAMILSDLESRSIIENAWKNTHAEIELAIAWRPTLLGDEILGALQIVDGAHDDQGTPDPVA